MSTQEPTLLQIHECVLGRYGSGKTKTLTPAMEIYKKVRSLIPRSGNIKASVLGQMKRTVGLLLQEHFGYDPPESTPITFWVDTKKAEQAGALTQLKLAHPHLRCWREPGMNEITYFVQDNDDLFLKLDLGSNNRRKVKITDEEKARIQTMLKVPSSSSWEGQQRVITSEVSVISESTATSSSNYTQTPSSNSMDHSSLTMDDVDTLFNHTSRPFQLQVGSAPLEEQIDLVCGQWICSSPGLETIKRKTSLAEAYKLLVAQYRNSLSLSDPFRYASTRSGLRDLNETLLVEAANAIGNAMANWYDLYPDSCLPGEEHAWDNELRYNDATGLDQAMEEEELDDGVLSFSGSDEEMQATLSDDDGVTLASHYLSQFGLDRDTNERNDCVGYLTPVEEDASFRSREEWSTKGLCEDKVASPVEVVQQKRPARQKIREKLEQFRSDLRESKKRSRVYGRLSRPQRSRGRIPICVPDENGLEKKAGTKESLVTNDAELADLCRHMHDNDRAALDRVRIDRDLAMDNWSTIAEACFANIYEWTLEEDGSYRYHDGQLYIVLRRAERPSLFQHFRTLNGRRKRSNSPKDHSKGNLPPKDYGHGPLRQPIGRRKRLTTL